MIAAVHQAEHRVAVRQARGDDAHRAQVEHLLERELLALHLPVDAVDVFGPAVDLAVDAGGAHHVLERAAQLGDVALAVGALLGQRGGDAPVVVGLQEAEREVFELPLELPQPQAVGERREHFARLEREPLARRGVAVLRGVEIDQLAREPRQHQARIADHRQQHLAQGFGLRRFEVVRGGRHRREPDVAEMRELARQRAHRRAEMQLDFARLPRAPRANAACAMQRGGEHRVLGQRGDDDRRFGGLIDGRARHAPAFEPGGMRVDRGREFRGAGVKVVHESEGDRRVRRDGFAAMIRAVFLKERRDLSTRWRDTR